MVDNFYEHGAIGALSASASIGALVAEEDLQPPATNGIDPSSVLFPVLAIGASAGGLHSLEQLLGRLKISGMAVIVMQHSAESSASALANLLRNATALEVRETSDGLPLTPDVIFVAPGGAELSLQDGAVKVRARGNFAPHHPIDTLLRSLAAERGANAIAVILSGAGSDGSLGVRAIKEEGGITFAEEPTTAPQPGMPRSAIESGCIDFVLPAPAIGDEVVRLTARSPAHKHFTPRFAPDVLRRILEHLHAAYGVDFTAYKLSTIERRITRRMLLQHIEQPGEYLRVLEAHRGELNALYDDLLIGVTAFFRDQEPFEALAKHVLPALFEKRKPEQPIRAWIPGCATGEEAYSLAISLLEYVEDNQLGHRLQIFATDIKERGLATARHGVYPESIELDVTPERLRRFFSRTENGRYQVLRKVRDSVVFARHNLGKDPPFSRLDLLSCRNVLIYLQPALQRRVMRVFHYALNPQGCLLLGAAESVGDASDLFSLFDRKLKIYVKKHGSSPGVFEFAFGLAAEKRSAVVTHPPKDRKPEASLQQLVDRKILDKYGPPGLLMDEFLDILQFRGQCAPYLAPSPGVATLNMLRMLRPELLVPLKASVQRVLREGVQTSTEPVRIDDLPHSVVMDVLPLDAPSQARCLLVLFRDLPDLPSELASMRVEASDEPVGYAKRLQALERELSTTKEYLETIIQELGTSNEELQSSNEELQSSNEELQSTNEELETSKEELQATNEELVTVNEELQMRISQLGVANDDVVNLLTNVNTAVLLVGLDLRIRRFSVAAEQLLNLIPSDLGRPVSYLGPALNVPQIESSVSEAIHTMQPREVHVRCANGKTYLMRTVPYQTADRSVRGGVIELTPIEVAAEAQARDAD